MQATRGSYSQTLDPVNTLGSASDPPGFQQQTSQWRSLPAAQNRCLPPLGRGISLAMMPQATTAMWHPRPVSPEYAPRPMLPPMLPPIFPPLHPGRGYMFQPGVTPPFGHSSS
ncbi:regulatory amdA, partial [Fusarium albosuccineum]